MLKEHEKGGFFGVSLGVGDVRNITLLALRVLNGVPIIAVPVTKKTERSSALARLKKMPVRIEDKEVLELHMPMQKQDVQKYWEEASETVIQKLASGQDIAFAGIGDLLHYGTFYYLEKIVKNKGFETLYIPGITSYQALASNLGFPLVQGEETLLVLPGDDVDIDTVKHIDCIVFLKKPDNITFFNELFESHQLFIGKNIGLKNEKFGQIDDVMKDLNNLPYFSLIIAKKRANLIT